MNFYPLSMIFAFISLINYFIFRSGIDSYLRYNRKSKSFIRKSKKGMANYWLYKKTHQEVNLGYIYYLNWAFIVLTPLYLILAVSLGWWNIMRIPIAILAFLLCGIQVPAYVFSDIYDKYENYGQPFILIRKSKFGRGFDSSIYIVLCPIFLLVYSIYLFTLAI